MADNRNGKIGFIVENKEVVNGLVKVSVRMLNSTLVQPTTNELPVILHAISNSSYANVNANDRFTYTFPFALAQGHGFPYVFDAQFEDDNLITLI